MSFFHLAIIVPINKSSTYTSKRNNIHVSYNANLIYFRSSERSDYYLELFINLKQLVCDERRYTMRHARKGSPTCLKYYLTRHLWPSLIRIILSFQPICTSFVRCCTRDSVHHTRETLRTLHYILFQQAEPCSCTSCNKSSE